MALALLVLLTAAGAVGAVGDIYLASTSDTGAKGNNFSFVPSLSSDGTRVAFESIATNLDPADTDSVRDIYVKNLASGDLRLASTSDTGVKGNGNSFGASLSSDGMRVAFYSFATNLDPADTDAFPPDVYVKDLVSGDLWLVSTSDAGVKGDGWSQYPSLSSDGTRVAFNSEATNLDPADTDTVADIYVKNLASGDIRLVSTSDTGMKGDRQSLNAAWSADGMRVAFWSRAANLDPADPDNLGDVYVKTLASGDIQLASRSDTGVKGNNESGLPSLSSNGTRVSFNSFATNLDPGDRDGSADVYVKNLASGDLQLASTSDTGVDGNSNSSSSTESLSSDGMRVGFYSFATNLDPADRDALGDVYVKDLASRDLRLASRSRTGVKGNNNSFDASLSRDGTRVAFGSTATNLHPSDRDTVSDVFVKEVFSAFGASVSGSGTVRTTSYGTGSFSFDVTQSGPRTLTWRDLNKGISLRSRSISSLVIYGNTARFSGTCYEDFINACTFSVVAVDRSPTGTYDSFQISASGGSIPYGYSQGGTLTSGNIVIKAG